MIRSIKHKGLRQLHEGGKARGIFAEHVDKLRKILAQLDSAVTIDDLDIPGFRLHPLTGEMRGYYAIVVRANWRVIFRYEGRDAFDVDYLDYH